MNNITDYVKQYGKFTINELPFNEVDSLVLSQFSYLKFDGLIPVSTKEDVSITLEQLSGKKKSDKKLFLDERYEKVNRGLYEAMIKAPRYMSMRLKDYVNVVSEETEEQFSALTCEFDDDFSYIVFRGTDDSMIGWKEDFNMGFMTPVPAQEHAVLYLNRSGLKCKGKIIVGGHSKGGNLAVYSSMHCSEDIKSKILWIYSHDGPGFKDYIFESEEFISIQSRIKKTVPRSSIVGMVLQTQEHYETVMCRNIGILQHDPFNWSIDGTEFKRADDIHEPIKIRNAALNQWISSLGKDKLEQLSEALFYVFDAADITNLNDFIKEPADVMKRLSTAVSSMDDHDKEMMHEIFSELVTIMGDNFREYVKENVVDNIKENVSGLKQTGDTIRKVLHIE